VRRSRSCLRCRRAKTSTQLELARRVAPLKRGARSSRLRRLVKDPKTRKPVRSRRNHLVAAIAATALLIALTACGGGAAPNPVGGADLGSPRAITIQTIAPSPTPSPTPLKTATPVPTASPLAIGDSCLIGKWTLTSLVMTDTASVPGTTLTFTGQVGTVMTLGAEGTEVYDLTSSTPLVGSGGGHTFSWQGEGVQRFQFHGEAGEWWESGPGQTATATHVVVDGVAQPDFSNVGPPIAGSYTCSGSNLRMTAVDPVDLTEIFRK